MTTFAKSKKIASREPPGPKVFVPTKVTMSHVLKVNRSREGFYDLELISAQAWRGTQTNSQNCSGGVSRET